MFSLQGGKNAVSTPDITVPFLDDGFNTGMEIANLKEGGDQEYHLDNVKMAHREKFSFSLYARPDIFYYLSSYTMGTDTLSGTTIPYTHTITRSNRRWITVERKLNTTVVQRLTDCKIESMGIIGEAGKPVRLNVTGEALTATIKTTAQTPSCDTAAPYMFYNGQGRFKIDTTTDEQVKGFDINIKINSGGGLRDDEYKLSDLPDFNFSVDCSVDLNTSNFTRWKKINYNANTTPQETLTTGALEIDLQQILTTTKQAKITIPYLVYQPIDGITLNPEGNTMTESIAGIGMKQNTTEIITMVFTNTYNEIGIIDSDDYFIQDNDGNTITGVY